MARVIGMVVSVSFSNTLHRMQKVWFWGNCLCPDGSCPLGCFRSLIIDPSQQKLLYTFTETSWCHLHRLHLHSLYLVLCGLFRYIFQLRRWESRFKYSVVILRRLVLSLSQTRYGPNDHNCITITIWSMVDSICTHINIGVQPKSIICWWIDNILWVSLQFALYFWAALSPN